MRVGIVGLQHAHIASFASYVAASSEHELVGWVEQEPKLRAHIESKFKVPVLDSTADLYGMGVDVIGLGATNRYRGTIILEALQHGVHVLADKPLLLSLDELSSVRELQKQAGLLVSLMLTERYNPPFLRLFDVIDSGDIGDVVSFTAFRPHKLKINTRPSWMFNHQLYGGLLADLAIHDIDIMRRVCKSDVVSINAWQANAANQAHSDFYDNAHAVMQTANGAMAWFAVNWLTPVGSSIHGDCRCFVQGTTGAVEVHVDGGFNWGETILTTSTHSARSLDLPASDIDNLYRDFFIMAAGGKPAKQVLNSEDGLDATEISLRAQAIADAARVALR